MEPINWLGFGSKLSLHNSSFQFCGALGMSKHSRDVELLRQIDNDLQAQHDELLCLRAQLATLLFPLKRSPPRKRRITRSNRSAARAVQRNERPASRAPVLLLMPGRPT